jgi:hypothetical protein
MQDAVDQKQWSGKHVKYPPENFNQINMADKKSLEVKVNALQRDMATIVKVVKELGASVKKLETNAGKDEKGEIEDILENQKMVDKIIVENSEAIERLEREISRLESQNLEKENQNLEKENQNQEKEASEDEKEEAGTKVKVNEKRCRYYNKGFCKYVDKCRYFHPSEICPKHLENSNCSEKKCNMRHPKLCKWSQKEVGCRRSNCDFLHVTRAHNDDIKTAHKETNYKCEGCKSIYPKQNYVVKHAVQDKELWFCLNCDYWITDKSKVLNGDWTLLDQNGVLRRDV